jgi:hypothetical protein
MSPDEAIIFNRTLELGTALAKDLDDRDLLGHWMAHHISDLITRARTASGPDSDALRQEACDTILKLWHHRADAALRSRPTHSIDVVIRALERLESPQDWLFYNTFRPEEAPDQNTMASIPALKLALDLEETTRDIVLQVLRFAANEAENKEAPWIQATEHLTEDNQRSIWRLMRQVDRRRQWRHMSADTDSDDIQDTDETATSDATEVAQILSALQQTQSQLAEICSAIEHVTARPETLNISTENGITEDPT